jgi:predicted neutral ceramidase superfamily lipid hydrolase
MSQHLTFVLISLLAGMVLGQRFRVLVLIPATAILLPVAVGAGIAHYDAMGPIMLLAALAVGSLQIGYLAGIGIRYSLAAARTGALRTGPLPVSSTARRIAH